MDKKHFSNDFKYYENYVELQSIELACFVLSVCDVVIVLEDWFFDPNLFRLLQTAEMLMPHNSLSLQEEYQLEHHPHIVYALNKIEYMIVACAFNLFFFINLNRFKQEENKNNE